jgi:ABC-type xylose transport system permease subunit
VEANSLVVVLMTAGILLAVAGAIFAGRLTARLLFHASRGDDLGDRPTS